MNSRLKQFIFELNVFQVLVILNIFNLLDAILTHAWISMGIAEESNPIMDYALNAGTGVFFITKISLVLLGSILLYHARNKLISRLVILAALFCYWIVIIYHCWGFYQSVL